MRRFIGSILTFLVLGIAALSAGAAENEALVSAFEVEQINEGLPNADSPLWLETPRAALETFVEVARDGEFSRAAHVLNLEYIPVEDRAERGPELAGKLAYLLRLHRLIDWSRVPDRRDARVIPDGPERSAPYVRRTIELGEAEIEGRPVGVTLQRFRPSDGEAVWLFSAYLVDHIDEWYADSGPGLLEEWLPLERDLASVGEASWWEWLFVVAFFSGAVLIWLATYYFVCAVSSRSRWQWSIVLRKSAAPLATTLAGFALHLGTRYLLALAGPVTAHMDTASGLVAVAAAAWLLMRVAADVTFALSQRFVVPLASESHANRTLKTRIYVTRRLMLVAFGLLSLGWVLSEIGLFENFGVSLLASAGAVGVLVAIAARPLLGNVVAGMQIALAQPLRIGDVVVFEGHWTKVEDIAFAHTVLRTWTDTCLIVPHSDILSKSFENWSTDGESVRRIVKLPVDFRVDVQRVREFVQELVEDDERRTSEAPRIELVEASADTATIWIWLSGADAMAAWTLHNDVREKVIDYLKQLDDGAYLPRRRHVLIGAKETGGPPEGEGESASGEREDRREGAALAAE